MASGKEHIKETYAERERTIPKDWYTFFNQGNLFIIHQRERVLLKLLDRYGMNPLTDKNILDIGCGTGGELRNFVRYGAVPDNVVGIDILDERIAKARQISQNIRFISGTATELPFGNDLFDIVFQFTVFSSIPDTTTRVRIADEMFRVLKPAGIIIWYDFGISKDEIHELLPGAFCEIKKTTLWPPIARRLAPYSWGACYLLEMIPFLRSHQIAVIKKKVR